MPIQLTSEEYQFLNGTLIGIQQNSLGLTTPSPQEIDTINEILLKMIFKDDFESKEVYYLQSILQVQSEIWGRRSSTANEKLGVVPHAFVPQRTLQLIKSISDKLGASLMVDTETRGDKLSPRAEGSITIMTDVTRKHIG